MRKITSGIVYEGPSMLDGAPIVAVITDLDGSSANPKTAGLAQLWIMRSDVAPMDALRTGKDGSVCGVGEHACKHSSVANGGVAGCYVAVFFGPRSVYECYRKGGYTTLSPRDASDIARSYGVSVRLGAYGDPAALPESVVYGLTIGVRHTGYTHQWRNPLASWLRSYVMASVDTPEEYVTAQASDWRTFRVKLPDEPTTSLEASCPASAESGYRTTCDECLLCDGTYPGDKRRSIAINVHGSGSKKYIALRATM